VEGKMLADPQTLTFPGSTTITNGDNLDKPATQACQAADDFRNGITHLTRGVAVVTSVDHHGERYGVTTTGVCALGMEPPTLVVCIRRRSRLGRTLPSTRRFCVNVLSSQQSKIAEAFAGLRGVDRFSFGRWDAGASGSPVLDGALASFECEIDLLYGYPDHLITVGSVRHVAQAAEHDDPLVYAAGQLSSLAPPDIAMAAMR
jgi:flavin reductase (DIM6/NTAB) family NADH-FMN oxidoreductase RutF